MSPAIAKLEALLSRVQQNRTKPRASALGVATPAMRAQPLALDEPLHLPPAEIVGIDLASPLVAAPVPVTPPTPEVARHPAPVEDEEPEITLGAGAAEEEEDEDEDDSLDTGERVAAEAPAHYTEPPAASAAAVHIAPTPTPPVAPAAAPRTSAQPVARAPGPPLRPTASPAVEARSPTPAYAPVGAPASEELPTTTREAPATPQRRAIEAAPLPASAAVAKITGAAAVVPRTFGALVARSLALRPKRS